MELNNKTPFHAFLFRGCIGKDRLYGSLAARITYDLRGNQLVLNEEQPWIISPAPWDSPRGPLEGDELFYRGGVDLFVFGSARPAGGRPAPSVDVTVQAGDKYATSVRVFGNRRWEKVGQALAMSPPEPFEEMPLTIEKAYGGADEWDELAIRFPNNPRGQGYAMSAESAAGKSLPNIEDPEHLIQKWDDQPEAVGVCPCPLDCAPRVLGRVAFDRLSGEMTELKATFFNHAFPRMIVPTLEAGATIRVAGVSAAGPVQFTLPPTPIKARVHVGSNRDERPVPIDQVGIEPDNNRVFVTYRYPFRYRMVPLEVRSCELLPNK